MEKSYITSPHLLSFPLRLFSRGAGLLGLLIFLLNFVVLIVMDSIRFLRETGLRRIAGTSTWNLWKGLFLPDLSFLLISTFLGLMLTWGLSRSLVYTQVWQDQVSGQQAWSRQENWQMLGLNRSANSGSSKDKQAVFSRWFQLIREADQKTKSC